MEAESEKDASEAKGRSSSRHNNKARASEGPKAVEAVPTKNLPEGGSAERKEQPGLLGVPGDLSIPADHITS